MSSPTIIAMWSGPRNISTAMMRAFENRSDTAVWDEPFYAHYLKTTGIDHPMGDAVVAAGIINPQDVVRKCLETPTTANRHGNEPDIWFQKHMTVHMIDTVPLDWMADIRNAFLIRNPEAVLASYHDRRADPTADDIGFRRQRELFDHVCETTGTIPLVVDSDAVLRAPETAMSRLCNALGIQYDPAMIAWPAGPRDDDGVWAQHWYKSVETSTGFAAPRAARPLPVHLREIAQSCRPDYDALVRHSII